MVFQEKSILEAVLFYANWFMGGCFDCALSLEKVTKY
jgi:hypothetical protein